MNVIMIFINPINALLWSIRRDQRDVINLYNVLSPLMYITTGSTMLNFGYWSDEIRKPDEAQINLCKITGEMAELDTARNLVDVGSGLSSPAIWWKNRYNSLELCCININYNQQVLANKIKDNFFNSKKSRRYSKDICLINSSSLSLPFKKESIDRIICLEAAQHFKPLTNFITQTRYILKPKGIMVIALPVITKLFNPVKNLLKLGILSFSWASEHYLLDYISSVIINEKFKVIDIVKIGPHVYSPLAEFYIKNRKKLKYKICCEYHPVLEYILYRSILKMDKLSRDKIIEYVIIKCVKM